MRMLNWVKQFNIFCLLDNNPCDDSSTGFHCMLAIGGSKTVTLKPGNAFDSLKAFHQENPGWLFGHLGYDLKNEDPRLKSAHPDHIRFPEGFFFIADILIRIQYESVTIEAENPEEIFYAIAGAEKLEEHKVVVPVTLRMSKSDYLEAITSVKAHIQRGDCYELNYCQEFYSENVLVDPAGLYAGLTRISPNPFAAFYRIRDCYCLCASPERFLMKSGSKLVSEPIKGTAERSPDPVQDSKNRDWLANSEKDKSENVMVVDLVRNDLSRVCRKNSVVVTNLFTIRSNPQVFQMTSTIEGTMKDMHWVEALRATFPMGSMTGAPKRRVMELTEEYEKTKRGLYSGAIGYITPEGDFDFNVVIRSLFYNSKNQYLSFMAGGGITSNSDPEKEYKECLMKIKAITRLLSGG